MAPTEKLVFPRGFLWGAATASYQIEGAAAEDGRTPSIWDTFSHQPGRIVNGDTGDKACDHYHRLDDDLDLIRDLGLQSYRFSVAWPRIQPDSSGNVNQRGLDFYDRLVDGLLARNVKPALTVYHWDLPQWIEDRGGWRSRETVDRFVDYAAIVARHLGDRVPMWMTHNEPWCSAWLGYGNGIFAPGIADQSAAAAAHHHLLLSHGRAVPVLRSILPRSAQVGIALNMIHIYPASSDPRDVAAARFADAHLNRSTCSPLFEGRYPEDAGAASAIWADPDVVRAGDLAEISAKIDFLGINNYHPRRVADPDSLAALRSEGLFGADNPLLAFGLRMADVEPFDVSRNVMGWPIEPAGLRDLLLRIARDWSVPIYVTENGSPFADYVSPEGKVNDPRRIAYLEGHLRAVAEAIAGGADVRGYFYWSLFDNFEWSSGYFPRFGLVYVDYPTSQRIPKASSRWYRDVIRANAVSSHGA
jgi:beta-glucosidase